MSELKSLGFNQLIVRYKCDLSEGIDPTIYLQSELGQRLLMSLSDHERFEFVSFRDEVDPLSESEV
ncbi:hypothetical protein ACMXYX_17925 (plasmid) [Neptuniibacter sp. QD72_48]|uniref:hypothetical protein n=1 Tax=Neptuniibacter sp. QD72_48 TaxID=3398214 RepID=UPI0039F48165